MQTKAKTTRFIVLSAILPSFWYPHAIHNKCEGVPNEDSGVIYESCRHI